MKKIIYFSLVFIFPFIIKSQQVPDSVTTFIENRVEVTLVVEDYSKLVNNSAVLDAIQGFQNHLSKIGADLQENESELLKYTLDSMLTVEPMENRKIFLVQEEQLQNTGIRDKAIFKSGEVTVIVISKDMASITELPIKDCLQKMTQMLPEKSAIAKSLHYQCIDGSVSAINELNKDNSYGDYIELSMGTGASLLKSTWVADLGFAMSFSFKRKGVTLHNPYVSTNLLYDFSQQGKMRINTFLNLGYRWNVNSKDEEEKLFGVEAGYLISRQGDFFDENTFRFGINAKLKRGIVLNPQLYMEDNFKRFYPGIRIGFGF